MKNKNILLSILVIITLALATVYYKQKKVHENRLTLSQMPTGGDINLMTSHGPFRLDEFQGKVVILYFGYTFCPDICPTTLSTIGASLKKLTDKELAQVQAVFISVDPKRDTLEKLDEYTKFFHPKILGVTDEEGKVFRAAQKYGVNYQKHYPQEGDPFYVIDHSTQAFLIDKTGKLAELIPHGTNSAKLIEILKNYID